MKFTVFGLFAATIALCVALTPTVQADDMVRFKLSMDGFGNCTVSVETTDQPLEKATEFKGEAVKSSRLPKSTILDNKEGVVRLVHDFSNPDEFDVLFTEVLGKPQNARFDQRFKALTLTSTREDDSIVTYAYRFKPPFTVIYDRYPLKWTPFFGPAGAIS